MRFSMRLASPIISASVATIVLTDFAIVSLAGREDMTASERFASVWPMALFSGCAIVLVMSFLYNSLLEFIRELEAREARANHLAYHDALTGLPNRTLLADRLDQAMARLRRDGDPVALLTLDVDRFKAVNDTLGHQAGDDLIREMARRLGSLTRDTDTVARLGGDEFAIAQWAPRDATDVERLCERVLAACREPVDIDGHKIRVTLSVGALLITNGAMRTTEALRKSDIALYCAKANGRDQFRLFSEDMDAGLQRSAVIEERLADALAGDLGLRLDFQPEMCGRTGKLVGVEALLRWSDAELGEVTPYEVLKVAEEKGMIDQLGAWVFERACEASRRWPNIFIAVNLSPSQFRTPDFVDRLIAGARAAGADPRRIQLEITEGVLVEGQNDCRDKLARLRAAGFLVALDDFGTGYSSLGYLRSFPVDKIKLDQAFVQDLRGQENSVAIIRAVVTLGHAMKLTVTAEGIETKEQEAVVRAAGCDELQGFLYSPAVRAPEIDAMIALAASRRHGRDVSPRAVANPPLRRQASR